MKLLSKKAFKLIAVLCCIIAANSSFGQCKNFTKKAGLPTLSPYTHNGQLTATKFIPGDEAEIEMTFNGGNDYRLSVVAQKVLGNVGFKVLDKSGKELYSSKKGENNPHWDFRVKNTQQLIVQVSVPEMEKISTKIVPQGCVSILVGFRDSSSAEKLLKLSK